MKYNMKWIMEIRNASCQNRTQEQEAQGAPQNVPFHLLMWQATSLVKACVESVNEYEPIEATTGCHASASQNELKQIKCNKEGSNTRGFG